MSRKPARVAAGVARKPMRGKAKNAIGIGAYQVRKQPLEATIKKRVAAAMARKGNDDKAELKRRAEAARAAMTDAEDAAITKAAEADPDNPPADDLIRRRGRPPLAEPKALIKMRVDPDVVRHFKADGPGWQTRMNDALRKAAGLD